MSIFSVLNKLWPKLCFQEVDILYENLVASGDDNGATPAKNVRDFSLLTRWANQGVGSWIRLELTKIHVICSVKIWWYVGETRKYHFLIETSLDASNYTTVFSGDSSGKAGMDRYLLNNVKAKYVRITVNGSTKHDNTTSDWAAINELSVLKKPLG